MSVKNSILLKWQPWFSPSVDHKMFRTEPFVSAYVISRLYYCNSVLAGLPKAPIMPLQRVQNSITRLIKLLGPLDHISSTIRDLHWLPVKLPNYMQAVSDDSCCQQPSMSWIYHRAANQSLEHNFYSTFYLIEIVMFILSPFTRHLLIK